MDFMKLLKSLEEVLYELVSWVVFYPLTLWRIIRHPIASLGYAERELEQSEDRQYDDSISPPILLMISLGLLHLIGQVIAPAGIAELTGALADERNLLAFRAVAFSSFPLLYGMIHLWVRRARVTRSTFKPVFYSQCFVTVPFVIAVSLGINLLGYIQEEMETAVVGGVILLAGLIWYGTVQSIWLSISTKLHPLLAIVIVFGTLMIAAPLFLLAAAMIGYAASDGGLI